MITNYKSIKEKIGECINASSDNMLLTYRINNLVTELYYAYLAGKSSKIHTESEWSKHLFNTVNPSSDNLSEICKITKAENTPLPTLTMAKAEKLYCNLVASVSSTVNVNDYISRKDIEKVIWNTFR